MSLFWRDHLCSDDWAGLDWPGLRRVPIVGEVAVGGVVFVRYACSNCIFCAQGGG